MLFEQIVDAARAHGVTDIEAIIATENQALTRFANNVIHQNVAERTTHISVRPIIDGRTARASTNRTDPDSIRNVVAEAIAITRLTEPDPELLPLYSGQAASPINRYFSATANCTPDGRARAVAEAIQVVRSHRQTAAGIYSTDSSTFSLYNSRGVSLEHRETMARFSITATDRASSGWAKGSACDAAALSPLDLATSAAQKAARSGQARELPAGRYTVILEPAAVLDLAGQMTGDFSATAIRDGRSFLNDRLGCKLFGENISIYDDSRDPGQSGPPFDAEGVLRKRLTLVDRGVVRDIACCRQQAAVAGVEPTGHGFPLPNEIGEAPSNVVFGGGETPLEEMIATTARGILVTRLWYIREVDPYEKIFTGMTRDGTFLVENGRIVAGVRNFRFNESLIEMLSNVEQLSPARRASGEEAPDMVVPAMKVRDFHFTEVTRF
jgi:PmbA protein